MPRDQILSSGRQNRPVVRKNTLKRKDDWYASKLREFRMRLTLYTSLLLRDLTNTVYDSLTMKNGSNLYAVFKVSQKQSRILDESRKPCTKAEGEGECNFRSQTAGKTFFSLGQFTRNKHGHRRFCETPEFLQVIKRVEFYTSYTCKTCYATNCFLKTSNTRLMINC